VLPGFFVLIGKRRKSFKTQGEFWRDGVREFTAQVKLGDVGEMTTREARGNHDLRGGQMAHYRIRRPMDSRQAAEAAFKKATAKPPEPVAKQPSIPNAKELVSLRIDRDVLEYFQESGSGWQDKINEALQGLRAFAGDPAGGLWRNLGRHKHTTSLLKSLPAKSTLNCDA